MRENVDKPLTDERTRRSQPPIRLDSDQQRLLSSSLQFVGNNQAAAVAASAAAAAAAAAPSGVHISSRCDGEEGDCMELKSVQPQVRLVVFVAN